MLVEEEFVLAVSSKKFVSFFILLVLWTDPVQKRRFRSGMQEQRRNLQRKGLYDPESMSVTAVSVTETMWQRNGWSAMTGCDGWSVTACRDGWVAMMMEVLAMIGQQQWQGIWKPKESWRKKLLVGAMQSQLVCNGCRTVLLYPRGAVNVCCALCNTVTSCNTICGCITLVIAYRNGDVPTNMWRLPNVADACTWCDKCEMLLLSYMCPDFDHSPVH
ncbi:hypothetical protein RJ640_022736 [Escallonia rubra]|uniref:Zinc finger LSD1-type domain-containing protein n=1 Tax=Escallonia rubra TaxID=112253 RepID=A0AA88UHG9_9ASTE|nr:hypothetical protein RJ640_022736 [Escallonia rubra]